MIYSPDELVSIIQENLKEEPGIDIPLVLGFIETESSFNTHVARFEPGFKSRYVDPMADSKIRAFCGHTQSIETCKSQLSTSFGLMQVMGLTAVEQCGFTGEILEMTLPEVGIQIGMKYLYKQLKRYDGDVDKAISAYNAGTATEDNQSYVNKVLNAQRKYSGQF